MEIKDIPQDDSESYHGHLKVIYGSLCSGNLLCVCLFLTVQFSFKKLALACHFVSFLL